MTKHSARAHAVLGASSAYRWMNCPGSVRMQEGIADETSEFAAEGTAAHELAEVCLSDGSDADTHLGRVFKVGEYAFTVDEEMAEAVQVYLDAVREEANVPGAVLMVEKRFDLGKVYDGLFGTNDACVYHPETKKLVVMDYKHGRGVAVEVADNPQLLYYALGACLDLGKPVLSVEIVVVQPRCPHPKGAVRRWPEEGEFSSADLIEWKDRLVEAAKRTEAADAGLKAGEWCKFCRAAGQCPEQRRAALAACQAEFSVEPTGFVDLVEPELMGENALANVMAECDLVEAWLKAVRGRALALAKEGRPPAGWKLVEKRATRKWADENETIAELKALGLPMSDILVEPKPRSPAQIEKLIGKKRKDEIAHLVTAESSGVTLALEADKRPAVSNPAALDFDEVV